MSELHQMIATVLDSNERILSSLQRTNERLDKLEIKQIETEEECTQEEKNKLSPYGFDPTLDGKYPGKTMAHKNHVLVIILKMKRFTARNVAKKLAEIYEVREDLYIVDLLAAVYAGLDAARKAGYIVQTIPGHFEIQE